MILRIAPEKAAARADRAQLLFRSQSTASGINKYRRETMRYAPLAGFAGVGRATVAIAIAALAQSPIALAGEAESPAPSVNISLGAKEIAGALRGKVCTTAKGAKFTFTRDGHYAYEGLWKNGGHYVVKDGAIIVILDNGLERSFAISRSGDVFYMERTALSCQ